MAKYPPGSVQRKKQDEFNKKIKAMSNSNGKRRLSGGSAKKTTGKKPKKSRQCKSWFVWIVKIILMFFW